LISLRQSKLFQGKKEAVTTLAKNFPLTPTCKMRAYFYTLFSCIFFLSIYFLRNIRART